MGLEKVREEILEKARKGTAELIGAALLEAKTITKSAEKQAEALEQRAAEEEERIFEFTKKKEIASAEIELQKQALALKNELVEKAFSEAREKIRQLSEKKRESHIKLLLEEAKKQMEVATVHCNNKDAKFLEGGKLKIVKDENTLGGIIAENPDGKLRIDYSYETMLDLARSEVLSDVARELSGK